ncbi:MAG: hypothetical protein WC525_09095 [Candidatus Thermoplasmatota archaeon]
MVDFKKAQKGRYAKLLKDGYQTRVTQPNGTVVITDVPPRNSKAPRDSKKPRRRYVYAVVVVDMIHPPAVHSEPLYAVHSTEKGATKHYQDVVQNRLEKSQNKLWWETSGEILNTPLGSSTECIRRALVDYMEGQDRYQQEIRVMKCLIRPRT